MVQSTTDYSIFKKHISNREVLESNVIAVLKSISFKNLLEFKPISVNSKMEIIDGQHRLEAAKRLGIPIFYEIKKDLKAEDIPLLNIQKAWTSDNYLDHYCSMGNINYISFKTFRDTYKMSTSSAIKLLGEGRGSSASFKRGSFVFDTRRTVDCYENMTLIDQILTFIESKWGGMKIEIKHLRSGRNVSALFNFLSIKSVDYQIFMKKLEMRLDLVRHCPTVFSYVKMYKIIYNYKNRNPIELSQNEINENSFEDDKFVLQSD